MSRRASARGDILCPAAALPAPVEEAAYASNVSRTPAVEITRHAAQAAKGRKSTATVSRSPRNACYGIFFPPKPPTISCSGVVAVAARLPLSTPPTSSAAGP